MLVAVLIEFLLLTYLGYVHLLIVVGGGGGAHAEVPGAVLPELVPDELLVDEGGALELRQHQPRHEQQLHGVPDGYPARASPSEIHPGEIRHQI